MSLKARIEAVIYAAEEPVTLAQLAALFGPEALEQKLAREEARAAESAAIAEADAQEAEEVIAAPAPEHEAEAEPPAAEKAEAAQPDESEAQFEAQPEAELTPEAAAEAAAEEEKRIARQREREIRDEIRLTVDELINDYASSHRGMEIREVAGGYRVGTKPEYHDAVRAFVKSLKPPIKLSLQALETLAVIAYKQPVTVPEVSEIRGVDSSGVIGSLIARKLVSTAGRKQVIGRPILYKTTKEFLLRFGLKDLSELPSMEEFEKMAGELAEGDEEPSETETLPFTEDAPVEDGKSDAAPAASAEVLAWRAEHGEPVASIPLDIDVTAEPELETEEDLPGVEIDAAALASETTMIETAVVATTAVEAKIEEPGEN
ncbi:MAG: SMC-Scp complex subunit ScpB [Acidobacteriaceae bacterium]